MSSDPFEIFNTYDERQLAIKRDKEEQESATSRKREDQNSIRRNKISSLIEKTNKALAPLNDKFNGKAKFTARVNSNLFRNIDCSSIVVELISDSDKPLGSFKVVLRNDDQLTINEGGPGAVRVVGLPEYTHELVQSFATRILVEFNKSREP